jgi:hypothetical protein
MFQGVGSTPYFWTSAHIMPTDTSIAFDFNTEIVQNSHLINIENKNSS